MNDKVFIGKAEGKIKIILKTKSKLWKFDKSAMAIHAHEEGHNFTKFEVLKYVRNNQYLDAPKTLAYCKNLVS